MRTLPINWVFRRDGGSPHLREAEFGPRKVISTAVEAIQPELSDVCSVLIGEQDVQFLHFRIPPPLHAHLDIFL